MGDTQAVAKTQVVPDAKAIDTSALAAGPEAAVPGGGLAVGLARMRPADVVRLQRQAGNRAVGTIIRPAGPRHPGGPRPGPRSSAPLRVPAGSHGGAVQRDGGFRNTNFSKSDEELITEAIEKKDVGLIKAVKNLGKAKGDQKMPLISILNHQGWIGPFDEYALETLWGSFGDKVLGVAKDNPGEWKLSLEGGAELYNLPIAKPLADKFIVDARGIAGGYLDTNEKYASTELANLGVKEGADGGAAGGPSPDQQNARLNELSAAIRVTKEARDVQNGLKSVVVGLERRYHMMADKTLYWPMTFNPDAAPPELDANPPPDRDEKARASGVAPESLARTPWKNVKAQWDVLTAIMTGLSIAYPVAGVGLMSGDKAMGDAAAEDPKVAKAAIVTMLTTTRDSIRGTRPKLAGGLAYELSPIHQQLFAGTKGASGIDWKDPIAQALAKEVLELKSNVEFWKSMGIATLAAAAFIIAEFATAGLATAALVGFGVGLGVGQAAVAWDKALTMSEADKATTGSGTELLASGQASMAMFEAALATVMVFVDVFQAAKPLGKALSGAVDKAALAAGSKVGGKVLDELGALAGKAPDKALVERAVTELGAEAVMGRTGKNAADLLAIVGEGSPIAARLKTLAAIPAELAKLTPAELAKRASNLAAEVQANAATGEALAVLAVERMGPKKVLEMNGGWKGLSLALGNESAAGKSIMSWRDAFMGDINAFVRTLEGGVDEAGQAAVKRTGTQGKFTNDFDISLLGPNASKNRNAVRSFMAGRVGTSPDRLGEMLLSDFFTDPRRLHLYDQLDPVLRAEVGTRAEKVAESTIMAKTLHDAEAAGNKELAEQIRTQMKELGVAEVPFKPLSEGDRAALYGKVDDYHLQLENALKSGDKAMQKSLVEKIGDTQGLINATEGGGYFSGGATRQIVTLAEGLLKGGTKPLDAQVYTTLLDQLPKLNSEASALMKSGIVASEEAVGAIKGIAKYGKRFRDLMSKLDVKVADEVAWDNLAERLNKLLKQAKGESDVTLLSRLETEAKTVESEVAALMGEFRGASQQVLLTLSRQAALGGAKVDLGAIQFLVMATAKLTRASSAVRESLRAITAQMAEGALAAAKAGTGQAPGTAPGTSPATTPPAGKGAVQPLAVADTAQQVQRRTRAAVQPIGRRAGNGAVPTGKPATIDGSSGSGWTISRLTAPESVQRGIVPGFLRSDKGTSEEIAAAIKSEDPADIKAIDDFSNAKTEQKAQLIQILLNKTDLWAFDRRAMARIWNSFPDLEALSVEQVALLRTCIDRGFGHKDLKKYPFIAGDFRDSVKAQVTENLGENIKLIQKEADRLGLTGDKPKEGEKYDEQIQELQDLAAQIKDAKRMLYQSRKIVVAYTGALEAVRTGDKSMPLGGKPLTFNPDDEPRPPNATPVTNVNKARREMPWRNVYPAYSAFTETIASILAQNPALYVLETLGEPMQASGPTKPGQDPALVYGDQSRLTGFEMMGPKQAREKVGKALLDVYNNARITLGRVMGGKMSPLQFDLVVSRHKQGQHGPRWSTPYAKLIAERVVAEDKPAFDEAMEMIGIVLILGAVAVGTGGAATPLIGAILAGANVASAAAAAAYKTFEAENTQQAANSAAGAKTAVTSQQQADRAALDAQMYQFMLIASIAGEAIGALIPAGRAGANLGAIDFVPDQAKKATMVVEALDSMEVGQVALRSGKSPEDLARIVATRSSVDVKAKSAFDKIQEFIGRIARPFGAARSIGTLDNLGGLERKAAAQLIEKSVIDQGIEVTLTKSKKTAKELLGMVGEQSSVAGRLKAFIAAPEELTKLSSEQLGSRLQLLAGEARLNATKAKSLVQLSVERLGPLETLRKGGGWEAIAKALGEEGAAMQGLVHWREAAMVDLYEHLGQLGATGGVKEAREFLSRRFGGTIEELGIGSAKPLIKGTGADAIDGLLLRVADDRALANSGLLGAPALKKMAEEGLALRGSWKALNAENRGKRLLDLANARLKEIGVPPMKSFSFSTDSDGLFLRSRWSFHLRESLLANDEKFDWLLEAAYHEARHAEQAYQIARVKAKEMSVDIMEQGVARGGLGIHREVAELAHANPIAAASAEGRQALRWYESMMGGGRDVRHAAYAAMDEAEGELKRQTAFYLRSKEVTPTLAPHAKEFVDKAWVDFENAVNRYKALPEEADAYAVQARFQREYERYKNLVADEALPPTVRRPKLP